MSTLPQGLIHLAPGYALRWDEPRQATVLVYHDAIFELSPVQGKILELCNGSLTAQGIVDAIQQQIPNSNAEDVQEFLSTAYINNWIHGQ